MRRSQRLFRGCLYCLSLGHLKVLHAGLPQHIALQESERPNRHRVRCLARFAKPKFAVLARAGIKPPHNNQKN